MMKAVNLIKNVKYGLTSNKKYRGLEWWIYINFIMLLAGEIYIGVNSPYLFDTFDVVLNLVVWTYIVASIAVHDED